VCLFEITTERSCNEGGEAQRAVQNHDRRDRRRELPERRDRGRLSTSSSGRSGWYKVEGVISYYNVLRHRYRAPRLVWATKQSRSEKLESTELGSTHRDVVEARMYEGREESEERGDIVVMM